jgi:hypothetical protein
MSCGLSFGDSTVLFEIQQLNIILKLSGIEGSFTQYIRSSHQSNILGSSEEQLRRRKKAFTVAE